MPEDSFSGWIRADESFKDFECPGVYITAQFATPPATVDPRSSQILYIGECTRQTLRVRTGNFIRVLTGGRAKKPSETHSGAANCLKKLGPLPRTELFLAFLPCHLPEPRAGAFVKLRERQLLWDFVCQHNKLPPGNKD